MNKIFLSNGIFMLNLDSSSSYAACGNTVDSLNWHSILEHISKKRMTRLARECLLGSLANVSLPMCESCQARIAYKKPFGKAPRASYPLELVY